MTGGKTVKKSNSMKVTEPLSKEQKEVGFWLRKNLATKKTKFLNSHVVEYFIGSKAVDALLNESPWSKMNAKDHLLFDNREVATSFLDELLKHKMFHRAKKIPVVSKKMETSSVKEESESMDIPSSPNSSDKKKRKIRLDMHLDQIFMDSSDAYVWIYDPIPLHYWAVGSLIVIGIIAICLFPLWPPTMRLGVHYLSLGGAGFLLCILLLAILQYVIFGTLYALSKGQLKFWIFPNLIEDVSFLESFQPFYDYTYTGASKLKDSDDEESDDEPEKHPTKMSDDSDSSSSKKSSTGKDFEMVSNRDSELESES